MSTRTLPVRNPRTGVVDFELEVADPGEVEAKAAALRAAQPAWAAKRLEERIAVMQRWHDEFAKVAHRFGEVEAVDTGGTHTSYLQGFITLANIKGWIEDAAASIERASVSRPAVSMPSVEVRSQLVPYPLVGVISPWNAPTMLALLDAVPALFAGSAVLWKPSEVTPRFVEFFFETVRAVPELAEVFDVVLGDGATGAAVVQEADVICFTGSVETGRRIAVAAAERLIPAYLELGGKDPVIVTETADLDRATTAVLRGATHASGMVCFSVERIYVHESVHDDFLAALIRKAEQVPLNHDNPKAGHIGPFTFGDQPAKVIEHVEDARAKGATVHTGGEIEDHGGLYIRPTVVSGVDHSMRIMTEETFGPCLPVMPYRDVEEAIALANDTEYGLTASVFAGTEAEAIAIAERINAGTVFVQDTFLMFAKGRTIGTHAFGASGLGGGRTGPDAIHRFLRRKGLLIQRGEPANILDDKFEDR